MTTSTPPISMPRWHRGEKVSSALLKSFLKIQHFPRWVLALEAQTLNTDKDKKGKLIKTTLKLKEQECRKLIKFNSNKVKLHSPPKNDTSLYSHLASGRLQVSLKVACLMIKPHWVQEDVSASEPTHTASENNRYYLALCEETRSCWHRRPMGSDA